MITFVAEDCVWLASLDDALAGTATARRIVGDGAAGGARPSLPRLNPSATRIAWTSVVGGNTVLLRGGMREVWYADIDGMQDGGQPEQLTHWADRNTATCGWLSDTEVLARSGYGHAADRRAWMFAVPIAAPPRELPCGPAADLAVRDDGARLLGTMTVFEPVYWKRYRGGCAGRVWYSPDGDTFEPVLASLGGNMTNPVWAGSRMAFLSDHEGVGALYSAAVDGSDLRRHGGLGPFYARNATSDGTRVVYEQAGRLFLLAPGDDEPVELSIRLADPAAAGSRRPGPGRGRQAASCSTRPAASSSPRCAARCTCCPRRAASPGWCSTSRERGPGCPSPPRAPKPSSASATRAARRGSTSCRRTVPPHGGWRTESWAGPGNWSSRPTGGPPRSPPTTGC
nr:protease [uncultured bacterium]